MVETYYNSGQFSNTVKVLCKQFDRPFLLYEALSDEYRARKMHEKKHSREAQYQFIRDFAAARTTLDDILVRQVMRESAHHLRLSRILIRKRYVQYA